jgi:ATP-dependent DNA helicase RecQ
MATPRGRAGGSTSTQLELTDADEELFEHLRTLRKQLADSRGVPAYVVFTDATLRAMAQARPTSPSEFLNLPGVGAAKLETYGEVFLDAIEGLTT